MMLPVMKEDKDDNSSPIIKQEDDMEQQDNSIDEGSKSMDGNQTRYMKKVIDEQSKKIDDIMNKFQGRLAQFD